MIDHFIAGLLFISVAFVLVVIGLRCLWPSRPPRHTGDHNWERPKPTPILGYKVINKDLIKQNNHIRIDDAGPKPMSVQERKELLKKWDEALNAQIDPKKNKNRKQKPITLSSSKQRKTPRKKK